MKEQFRTACLEADLPEQLVDEISQQNSLGTVYPEKVAPEGEKLVEALCSREIDFATCVRDAQRHFEQPIDALRTVVSLAAKTLRNQGFHRCADGLERRGWVSQGNDQDYETKRKAVADGAAEPTHYDTHRVSGLVDIIGDSYDGTIYNPASGKGRTLTALAERNPDCMHLGVDLSHTGVCEAIRHFVARGLGKNIRFEKREAISWTENMAPDSLGAGFTESTIHIVGQSEGQRLITALGKAIKPGGHWHDLTKRYLPNVDQNGEQGPDDAVVLWLWAKAEEVSSLGRDGIPRDISLTADHMLRRVESTGVYRDVQVTEHQEPYETDKDSLFWRTDAIAK